MLPLQVLAVAVVLIMVVSGLSDGVMKDFILGACVGYTAYDLAWAILGHFKSKDSQKTVDTDG